MNKGFERAAACKILNAPLAIVLKRLLAKVFSHIQAEMQCSCGFKNNIALFYKRQNAFY